MRYYLYISDTKVDMLLSQIPSATKHKIATEFKLDLKLITASRRRETEYERHRTERLEAVLVFLDEFGDVGSVDEPDEYFRGQMRMRWGPFTTSFGVRPDNRLIYFGGVTDKTIIGLGGSSRHVIGNIGDSHADSASATPYIVHSIMSGLASEDDIMRDDLDKLGADFGHHFGEAPDMTYNAIYLATARLAGSVEHVEYVAKTLYFGRPRDGSDRNAVLGTPLYVARVR